MGGQQGLGNRLDTESLVPGLNANLAPAVFSRFGPGSYGGGNLGIRYSAAGFTYPGGMQMGWVEFFNRKANLGLYYANHDPESRLTGLYFELRPFTKTVVVGDNWPTTEDLPPGEPIGLTMGWMKFPYLKRGTFKSGPVALQVHPGDWHEGSELAKKRDGLAVDHYLELRGRDRASVPRLAQAGSGREEIWRDNIRDFGMGHGRHRSRLPPVPS